MEIPSIIKSSVPKACLKKKGDLATVKDDGQLDTISVGPDGSILVADSAEPTGVKWVSGSGSAGITNWGTITGTLSNQGDLQNALNGKEPANTNIQAHIATTGNPHGTTKDQIGLGSVTNDAQIPKSVATAKGSLIGFSGSDTPVEIPVGADTKVLTADSTQVSGLAWKDVPGGGGAWGSITGTLSSQLDLQAALDAKQADLGIIPDDPIAGLYKGTLIGFSASNIPVAVPAGTDGYVFVADSTKTPGVEWKARIPSKVVKIASSATPTPNADTTDLFVLSALAEAATFGAPTGTPVDDQPLKIRIKDNGIARALSWNAAAYRAIGCTLPTTTIISKLLYVGMRYNSDDGKWDVLAVGKEG